MMLQVFVNVGDCFPSIHESTHLLRIIFLTRVRLVQELDGEKHTFPN